MDVNSCSSAYVACSWSLLRILVFVPEFEHLLILGCLQSHYVADLLRDCLLYCFPLDCPWLLCYARAALCVGTSWHCWSSLAPVLDPHRLQGCSSSVCRSGGTDLCVSTIRHYDSHRSQPFNAQGIVAADSR
ncbi:hypothetical protein KC19_VG308200 [Ceratodon purpureus]|uniref:Uncharacterized protein n=1 Tax=Ceratodon purpureus TaxID=3225 RepID=A0A8T0HVD9_CERPU|nr:hypothetical protein KC19_VG308200 [Ceratodon purpureus]